MKRDGIMMIALLHGVLSRGGAMGDSDGFGEGENRQSLIWKYSAPRMRSGIFLGRLLYSFTPPSVIPAMINLERNRYTTMIGTMATVIIM